MDSSSTIKQNSMRRRAKQQAIRFSVLGCLVWIAASTLSIASTLSVTIRDEHGTALPARVYLTNAKNKSIFPNGAITYDKTSAEGVSEKDFVPRHGRFSIELPAGTYRLVIERGKEYLPIETPINLPASTNVRRTIVLHRWIDMAAKGWFSADMHVHRSLADLPSLMEAEDLNVAIPITRWKTVQQIHEDPDLHHYLSLADRDGVFHLRDGRFFPVLNEEMETRDSALLASFLGTDGVALTYPLSQFGQSVQAKGGVSDSEKATSLELPGLAAVGTCQTVGLANNHLWRSGSYTKPWGAWPDHVPGRYPQTCRGFVRAGFDIYAALLNMGFPLTLSAGSASGVHPVPPGWSRVYVHSGLPLTPKTWLKALKQGKSFVTTGPMLLLEVNGQEPGDQIHEKQFPLQLHAKIEMLSLRPVSEAEIVLNGIPHKVALSRDPKNQNRYTGAIELTIKSSTWITARWSASRGQGCDAAHTSPIYFWDGKKPIPTNRKEAQLLLDRVNSLIGQISNGDSSGSIVVDSDDLRNKTLEYLKQAKDVYQRKVNEALP